MSEKIIAYKAMNKNMQCRGKQYEVGKTYTEEKADCCHAGMHACENPLDVLHYYPLKDGPRFFEVECGGNVDKSEEGSKLACTELTVKGEVNFAGLVKATVNAAFNRVKGKEPFSSGNYSTAGSSGNYSTAGSSGNYSTAGPAAMPARRVPAAIPARRVPAAIPARRVPAAIPARRGPAAITVRRQPLVLTEYDDDGNMLLAKMAKVDGAVIKENTWYTLKNGEFVEAEP